MNGQRGMSTLGAVLLAATAGLLTATLMMDWMVVDVHVIDVSKHDDIQADFPVHVTVPFPLLLADIATGFVPDGALAEARIPPEARVYRELVLDTMRALLDSPDAEFVKVRSEDANIDISKEGDTLRIAIDADDAIVRCNVPIDGILEALEDWDWETVDPKIAFDVLHAADNGDLVTVATSDGVRVAIKMW